MAAVGMVKSGPALGILTAKLLEWQLGRLNPTEAEAKDFLMQQSEASVEGKFDVRR